MQGEDFQAAGKAALDAFHEFVTSGAVPNWTLEEVRHQGRGGGIHREDNRGMECCWCFHSLSHGSSHCPRQVNHEGWRVNVDEGQGRAGWVLLRQSLHDPLLVLNVESEVECGKSPDPKGCRGP